jgi:hypothetical protein
MVGYPTAPSFATVNLLQTHPTLAPALLRHGQHTENLVHHITNSTTPVPLVPKSHHSPRSFLWRIICASLLRLPSESPSSASETENTPSRHKHSKRVRISRRNPFGLWTMQCLVNKNTARQITVHLCFNDLTMTSLEKKTSEHANQCLVGRKTVQTSDGGFIL